MKNFCRLIWVVLCAFGLQATAAQSPDQAVTVERLEWRPHSNQVTLGLTDGQVLLHDLTSRETLALPRHTDYVTDLAWDRAGTQLISVSLDGSRHIWNAATQAVRTYIPPPPPPGSIALDELLAAAWSTDGTRYALGDEYGYVSIHDAVTDDVESGFFLTEIFDTASTTPVSGLAWNRDDTKLYVVSAYDGVVWDVRENRLSQIFSMPPSDVDSDPDSGFVTVDYSSQQNALALGAASATTAIWDSGDGTLRILQEGNAPWANFVVKVQWGPFQQVLSVTREGQAQLWDVRTTDTMSLLPIPGVSQAVWSPYGGRIAYIERNAQIADTTQGSPLFTVPTIVPAPSLDRLNAIAALCVQDGNGELDGVGALLSTPATQAGLADYVSRIRNLPAEAIPAACVADLLAVAETLMAQDAAAAPVYPAYLLAESALYGLDLGAGDLSRVADLAPLSSLTPAQPDRADRRLWLADIDPSGRYLYQIEAWGRSTDRRILGAPTGADLVRIDLATGAREIVLDKTTVFNFVLSPNGQRMLVFFYAGEYLYSTQMVCVWHIITGNCVTLDYDYVARTGFWVDDESFVIGTNDINPLRLIDAMTGASQTLRFDSAWQVNWGVSIPRMSSIVITAQPIKNALDHPISFFRYDLISGAFQPLGYSAPNTYQYISLGELQLSPDATYLLYKSLRSALVDFTSGALIQEFTAAYSAGWIDDHTLLLQGSRNDGPLEIMRVDAATGQVHTLLSGDDAAGWLLFP